MKKIILTLTALIGSSFLTQNASAAVMPYEDFLDVDIHMKTLTVGEAYTGMFDIVTADDDESHNLDIGGFDPSSDTIVNAAVAFSFFQEKDGKNEWSLIEFDFNDSKIELNGITMGESENGIYDFDFVLDSANILDQDIKLSFLADIQEDGLFAWSITLNSPTLQEGDFQSFRAPQYNNPITLFAGALGVEVADVPDNGTTFALFGLSVFGLAAVRRRIR